MYRVKKKKKRNYKTRCPCKIKSKPKVGAAKEGTQPVGNGLYLSGRVAGATVWFLVDTGLGVSLLASKVWNEWVRLEEELEKYWGWLCFMEGRALECMGRVRMAVTLGTQAIDWDLAEIGKDEGILGNGFADGTHDMHPPGVHPHTRPSGAWILLATGLW